MSTDEEIRVRRLTDHRFSAIALGRLMLEIRETASEPNPSIHIKFDGYEFEGRASVFINPVIEIAILHCRAALEFLGLNINRKTSQLQAVKQSPGDDDLTCANFAFGRTLQVADVEQLCPLEKAEITGAVAYVIRVANKGLAHTTMSYAPHSDDVRTLLAAFKATMNLLEEAFYRAEGIEAPSQEIASRPRQG